MASSSSNLVAIILAILIPPLGVFAHSGINKQFWICLVLTFFFYIPGLIYALYVIL